MHYTMDALMTGNRQVGAFYAQARSQWRAMLAEVDVHNTVVLARLLSAQQLWFEQNCGGRWLGQEVMAVVGFVQFYSLEAGFGDNLTAARSVAAAFEHSSCSLEVKGCARWVAKHYALG